MYRKNSKLEKIHLPVNQSRPLVERIRGIERRMQEAESLLLSKNVLKLTYEDDIEQDPQSAYRSICEFVNMEPTKASVNFSKTKFSIISFRCKENFAEVNGCLCWFHINKFTYTAVSRFGDPVQCHLHKSA